MRGWIAYFGFCQTPSDFRNLDSWIRRRLRYALWQKWKTIRKRYAELVKRGVRPELAKRMAGSNKRPWHRSLSRAMSIALPNATLSSLGLFWLAAG